MGRKWCFKLVSNLQSISLVFLVEMHDVFAGKNLEQYPGQLGFYNSVKFEGFLTSSFIKLFL